MKLQDNLIVCVLILILLATIYGYGSMDCTRNMFGRVTSCQFFK